MQYACTFVRIHIYLPMHISLHPGTHTAQHNIQYTAHVCQQASVPEFIHKPSVRHVCLVYEVYYMVAGYNREGRRAAAALLQAAAPPAQRGQ